MLILVFHHDFHGSLPSKISDLVWKHDPIPFHMISTVKCSITCSTSSRNWALMWEKNPLAWLKVNAPDFMTYEAKVWFSKDEFNKTHFKPNWDN